MRIGHGFDVHRLVPDRKLILGGIRIPYHLGLLGHSDADVLCHAISDAILGAAALGDIGKFFPDTDVQYKDISSIILLKKVNELIIRRNMAVYNIDSTIIAQQPRIAPYISEIRDNLAQALKLSEENVSVKATTTEELGFTGRGEGIAVHAVVLLEEQVS
ncbi:2-C-methyl-D-erythritol 2,4-cyclodiphosphate synthase [candidate division KSB1 bacterium]|nr:2-C-methyl-D-erythritol 2,4-cyclodiphosphate synthase [candidate division KSB1 bacterium]